MQKCNVFTVHAILLKCPTHFIETFLFLVVSIFSDATKVFSACIFIQILAGMIFLTVSIFHLDVVRTN